MKFFILHPLAGMKGKKEKFNSCSFSQKLFRHSLLSSPMHLPLLPPLGNSQVYVKGDVSIDDGAAIAPGAILQAAPDSKIIIAAGVCIGMGTILHAYEGTIEVETGAVLGAGVLVVGKSKIGANACIGSTTTVFNSNVESWQVVPPGSLFGDNTRQIADTPTADTPTAASSEAVLDPQVNQEDVPAASTGEETQNGQAIASTLSTSSSEDTPNELTPSSPTAGTPVYGQANLNRLLTTLFPHYKSANHPPKDTQSS
ncbi:carbon dioxide concentrating mechanism protein [Coleofasciculus sp. FACHB-SPT36]|uniref:carbon dioxide concentrating mechanism protein n=1 Tax=Cyanophyceae TaxID=3028117 RepID=UPI001F55683C|nr:carbon dioxide concentrating mechanism protein [Coleofasciculus sp. FACHB-SPT36]